MCFGQKCMALVGYRRSMLGNECYDYSCRIILLQAMDRGTMSRRPKRRSITIHMCIISSSIWLMKKRCVSSCLSEPSCLVYVPCLLSMRCSSSSLSKIIVPRLRSVLRSSLLAHARLPTDFTPDTEPRRIGIIMSFF